MPKHTRIQTNNDEDSDSDGDFIVDAGPVFPKLVSRTDDDVVTNEEDRCLEEKEEDHLATDCPSRKISERIRTATSATTNTALDLSPKAIEEKAQKSITGWKSTEVESIDDWDRIGWYLRHPKSNRGKKRSRHSKSQSLVYPVIKCAKDDVYAKGLLGGGKRRTSCHGERIDVQYMGAKWTYALTYENIAASKFCSYSSLTQEQNEDHLEDFLRTLTRSKKASKLSNKIEELHIRRNWDIVRANVEAKQQQQQQSVPTRPSIPTRKPTLQPTNDDDDDSDSDDSDVGLPENTTTTTTPGPRTRASTRARTKASNKRARSRTPLPRLQLHDEIEYYDLRGSFGDPQWLIRDTIVGFGDTYPLQLSNSYIGLPKTHKVRKVSEKVFLPICEYRIQRKHASSPTTTTTTTTKAALETFVERSKSTRDKIVQAANDFWRRPQNKTINSTKP